MNILPRYVVAKYAPDLNRMEPRNIGIIVWAQGHTATKFVGSEDADFVADKPLFNRWVRFWEAQITEAVIRVGNRKPVSRTDPGFIDELCRTQKGHYLLFDAGRIHEELATTELESVAEFLFEELVAVAKPKESLRSSDSFQTMCDNIVGEAGLTQRNDWQGQQQVQFRVSGIEQEYQFNYVLGNGLPWAVGHRVPLNRPLNVNNAAFLFEWIRRSKVVSHKRNRFALVDTSCSPDAEKRIRLLDKFANVVDVANQPRALKKLSHIE